VFVFVFVTEVFCYSCDSGAVWPAGCCSAAGRARAESAVPVLCSGFLWADGCADSNYCEVSSYFCFYLFLLAVFCGFGFSVFLLLLAVVDYLMMVLVLSFVLISAIPSNDDLSL
jgi:hypothetical protein